MTTHQLFRHLGARAAKPEKSQREDKQLRRETVKTVSSVEPRSDTGLKPGVNESVKPSVQARPFNWADESSFHQYGVSMQ